MLGGSFRDILIAAVLSCAIGVFLTLGLSRGILQREIVTIDLNYLIDKKKTQLLPTTASKDEIEKEIHNYIARIKATADSHKEVILIKPAVFNDAQVRDISKEISNEISNTR